MRKYDHIPQPFVIYLDGSRPAFLESDSEFGFGIRLFGSAIESFPYLVFSVMRIGERGLGRDRVRFDLLRVTDGETTLYHPTLGGTINEPTRRYIHKEDGPRPPGGAIVRLNYLTPTRIKTGGEINMAPTFGELFRACIRRLRILSHFYGMGELVPADIKQAHDACESARTISSNLEHFKLNRKSRSQGVDMPLEGVIGSCDFHLPDSTPLQWLQLAEPCHIGKATSFGFGRFKCEVLEA